MPLPPIEVIKITVQLLDSYNWNAGDSGDFGKTEMDLREPEDFLEERFQMKSYSPIIKQMSTRLFFSVLKYRKFFITVLNDYYRTKNREVPKSPKDASLLAVIFCLALIKLKKSNVDNLVELLVHLDEKKFLSFFNYLKKPSMTIKMFEWGCQIWDAEYVKDFLSKVIDDQQFKDVYVKMKEYTQEKTESKIKKLTVPIHPNVLNHPKKEVKYEKWEPPSVSPSSVFPPPPKPLEVPKTTYVKPSHDKKLEEARLKNHQEAIQLYEEAQKKAFSCAGPIKSRKYVETVEKIKNEIYGEPKKNKIKPKLSYTENVPTPKKTAAVILREGARLMKLEKEEIKRYEELASGAFNDDALIIFENEIREGKIREDLEEIERKHLQGLISYEDAVLAKQKYLRKSKENADELRREKENWLRELENWKQEERKRIKECVVKEKENEKNVKEAVEHVKEEKHKKAMEAMEESKKLREKWLKEKEEDLQKKIQLIQEIKALQVLGVIKKENFDLTKTANLGFLCEMSIAELKERLILIKLEIKEEIENRREVISKKRECRKEIVESYQGLIESHKETMKLKKESQKTKQPSAKKTSKSVEHLRKKLEEKRNQRFKPSA